MRRELTPSARGLGLRGPHLAQLCAGPRRQDLDFLELAPENWMDAAGLRRQQLDRIAALYPLVAHGLSLSVAGTCPLDFEFLDQVRQFLDDYAIAIYSEHLSLTRDRQGYLYDLIPVPRYRSCLDYFADRIQRVQDRLRRPLVLENITSYHSWPDEMDEGPFFARLVEKTGCQLLLDINNLYVNSQNRGQNPMDQVHALPGSAICYWHMAGHFVDETGMRVDSHGTDVDPAVIALAQAVCDCHGPRPLLLERDNSIPPLDSLCAELGSIHDSVFSGIKTRHATA